MKKFNTDREFLQEIEAWLCFNSNPPQDQILELKHTLQNHLSIPIEPPVIKPPFTLLDIDFIETLIRDNEEEGSYYGNLNHYNKRRERIKEQLNKMREAL